MLTDDKRAALAAQPALGRVVLALVQAGTLTVAAGRDLMDAGAADLRKWRLIAEGDVCNPDTLAAIGLVEAPRSQAMTDNDSAPSFAGQRDDGSAAYPGPALAGRRPDACLFSSSGLMAAPGQPSVEDHARAQNAADLAAKSGTTDPLVATFEHAVYDLGNADQNGPTAADVLRCGRDMRAKRARLSAVLAAARAVVDAYKSSSAPDSYGVEDLESAIAAADGAA